MTTMTDLKPCPFCGGKPDPQGWKAGDGRMGPECEDCGATAASDVDWEHRLETASAKHAKHIANLHDWLHRKAHGGRPECRVLVIEVVCPPKLEDGAVQCVEDALERLREHNAAEIVDEFYVRTDFDETFDVLMKRRPKRLE